MSGSDIVFIAATIFALIGSGAVYAFAKSVERRHRPTSTSTAAREEARRAPFRAPGPLVAQSLYASMSAIARKAKRRGKAVDMRVAVDAPLARNVIMERERERA